MKKKILVGTSVDNNVEQPSSLVQVTDINIVGNSFAKVTKWK